MTARTAAGETNLLMSEATLDPERQLALEQLGRVLGGKWRLDRLLGIGGMAAVYGARGPEGEEAAVKVLHPEMSRRADIRQRFAQEGMAATRVAHPGAVRVLETGEEPDGTAYLVLELLQGEPLGDIVKREKGLPVPRLLQVLDEVLDVLAAAHAKGIVHRDLKPDNLFVTTDGHTKVLDFGIARVLDDVPGAYKTRTGITLGTMPYMSPEQALGKRGQVDGRSDLFSLGAMTFRIVAGRNVHEADTDAEMLVAMASKPAPPLRTVAPEAPPGLCAIVDLAVAFGKDSRYPDAATMQGDVRALAAGNAPPYAARIQKARDMATRTDMPVPVIPPSSAPVATRLAIPAVPASRGEAAPRSREAPTVVDPPLDAAPPSSLSAVAFHIASAEAPDTVVDADLPPPSSLRAIAMPAVDPAQIAGAARRPISARAPASSPVSTERTLPSTPPPSLGPEKPRPWMWIALAVLVLLLLGAAYWLVNGSEDGPPPPATKAEETPTAAPAQTATQVATTRTTPTTATAPAPAPTPAPAPAAVRAVTEPAATAAPATAPTPTARASAPASKKGQGKGKNR